MRSAQGHQALRAEQKLSLADKRVFEPRKWRPGGWGTKDGSAHMAYWVDRIFPTSWAGWGGVGEGLVAEETSWWEVGMGTGQHSLRRDPCRFGSSGPSTSSVNGSEVSSGLGVRSF